LMSLNIYLMLFTHVAPCTKSKGLPIDVPQTSHYLILSVYVELTGPD
jgi:hypothetical protein